MLHYSLFQAAFSDTVTSASAPPNSSKFKNDAGILYRFCCESRANRESCHHSVFPFQRQMNALLPRDQATLPKACLGSLLGPMFARRVLLLALWPLGKLEATLLETSDSRVISIMRPAPHISYLLQCHRASIGNVVSDLQCLLQQYDGIKSKGRLHMLTVYAATSEETASV